MRSHRFAIVMFSLFSRRWKDKCCAACDRTRGETPARFHGETPAGGTEGDLRCANEGTGARNCRKILRSFKSPGSHCTRTDRSNRGTVETIGDMQLTRAEIAGTQVIVTTPEKWDVITRKSGDNALVEKVKLLVLDEVHLLASDRGNVVESITARTLRQVGKRGNLQVD